jgi:hypothetical protein
MISSLYLHSKATGKSLRVGVMIDGGKIPRVFHKILTDIERSDFANVELAIINQEAQPSEGLTDRRLSRSQKLWRLLRDRDRGPIFYEIFHRYDRRRLRKPNPLETIDCTDVLGSRPRLDVIPVREGEWHRFPPDGSRQFRVTILM